MKRVQTLVFCAVCLIASLVVFAALFPFAAMSPAEVRAAREPMPMENFELVDLGDDYGQLTVIELIGYYMENPPQAQAAGAVPEKKHFGGC